MGFFSRKKKEKNKEERITAAPEALRLPREEESREKTKKSETEKATSAQIAGEHLYTILKSPRITEKATDLSEHTVYVFEVRPSAKKHEVKKAVETLYGVHPERVRIVQIPSKKVFARGVTGRTSRAKKAYVKLREGERIELI